MFKLKAKFKSEKLRSRKFRPYFTYGLIMINLAVFGLEIWWGGAENPATLYRMGALVPEVAFPSIVPQGIWQRAFSGEWWRVITATFLHFGWLHLTMNMLGLAVIAPLVERFLGRLKFLITYCLAGFGSMLLVAIATLTGLSKHGFILGASGAVMGMVGAQLAIYLKNWWSDRNSVASRQVRSILLIIGFQTAFDLTMPNISFIGHLAGTVLGFLITSFIIWTNKALE